MTHDAIGNLDRTRLPLPDTPTGGRAARTIAESVMPVITPIRPPQGAPNVVIVLLDDVGFGATATFGGPVPSPAGDALAQEGLRYNRFHTTALCSPTRAALLTGRNHHVVNTGNITEWATGYDGYNSIIPRSAATVAETLRLNGYSTAAFGKWHNTPVWEVSPSGPFDRWPTSMGFEEFYGFMGGEAHQYNPGLYHGTTPVERPENVENYHLTTDLADRMTEWVHRQRSISPDRPFFVYWAPGATHAPHHVAPHWSEPFRGQFDQGWDTLREETFARQKQLGVIPADAELTPRHPSIPAWDSISPDRQRIAARLMEVYAGFLAHTDDEIGRMILALKDMSEWDNTLFFYIIGDNGAAPAGGIDGVFNEMVALNGLQEDVAVVLSKMDEFGGPKASNEYPVGFAWAMSTPFQFTKQFASHFGGTRNPMIVTWPERITDKGGLRSQFHHVIDIAPTILEAAGIPAPTVVNGVDQRPYDGISVAYTFDSAAAQDRRRTQYFEIQGTRGIYHEDWIACTYHGKIQWKKSPLPAFSDDRWELYDLSRDYSQAVDLAAEHPDKLAELQALFEAEAENNDVFPLDDRGPIRAMDARPTILGERTSISFAAGAIRMPEDIIRSTFNRSYSITAAIDTPGGATVEGVLLAAGGYFAGLSLYVQQGLPRFTYNYFGSTYTTVTASELLPAGEATVSIEFDYDGGGLGNGGVARLLLDGRHVGESRIERTVPFGFSADEGVDIGMDGGTPAADTYEGTFPFNSTINEVTIQLR
ncbi:MAG: arylsulfatase [Actinomycetota bacterium]|uniref:Arylsulfatase n=1 Tax=Mycobacterium lentiflavum TaxID=141349 RepID=A0ABY3UQV2_MYCLN|nr:arylsulfatase [Mycobacterium lentiflavum]MEE3062917.1 arylsulfatase [Actinomycetota bacterium]ULP40830.1 arylsulfatase [Mycobacterium lentiflavum]